MMRRFFALLTLVAMMTLPLFAALVATGDIMLYFVFFYPLLMSGVWVAGGMYFWFYRERRWRFGPDVVPAPLKGNPLISILIPCFNEGLNVRETISAALAQTHENIEVIAINDGSKDDTGALLNALALEHPRLRVIHLAENQGKAIALRMGAMSAQSDFLVCIDGDAVLDPRAAAYLVSPLLDNPRVGAVTGNPRVRTRATLIGRLQVGEFSSIIGLIKRTQRVYGKVFTISGVIAAFRRRALSDVGYWSPDMITEDIDISWKLQLKHWPVFYEPRALCWILMPETLKGLWKQRLRWAQGGAEVFLKYMGGLWRWQCRRMWTLFIELFMSTFWAFTFSTIVLLYFVGLVVSLPPALQVESLFPPAFTGLILATACLIQFCVSLLIDRAYEPKIGKNLFWVIWYPAIYWMLSLATTTVAFPKVMLRARQKRARWVFEDRGLERSRT